MPANTKSASINSLPNGVYVMGASQLGDLKSDAKDRNQRFLYASFEGAGSKRAVLGRIAEAFRLPDYFGYNLDALADCLTDLALEGHAGFVIVLEFLPQTTEFDGQVRKILLEVFLDVAEFWAGQNVPFHVFYSLG